MNYRIKYWVWINPEFGEWHRTGLMSKDSAEKVAKHLRLSHEMVEIYYDEDSSG